MTTKIKIEHSPLPWHGEGQYAIWGPRDTDTIERIGHFKGKFYDKGSQTRIGEVCHDDWEDEALGQDPADKASQDNRDFIVRACNSFGAMLDALNSTWDFIDDNAHQADKKYPGTIIFSKKEYDELMKKIEDAVYLAAPELFTNEYRDGKNENKQD